MDERIRKLAENLVTFSVAVKPGENVLIEYRGDEPVDLIKAIVKEVYKAKGLPFVNHTDMGIHRQLLMGASREQLEMLNERDLAFMKQMDCFIAVSSYGNSGELSDVPQSQLALYTECMTPMFTERVNNTRWVVLRYPNPGMAQQAGMSNEAFEDFYFDVCTMDYSKMDRAMDALKKRMESTDIVRMIGPGTDLTMSIKGMPAIKCSGNMNIPDGEIYTAPVRDSVNGVITYNTPSLQEGFTYENIRFEIRDGRIIKATANDNERINRYLDADEGARYFGEFAIGVNPYVMEPMKETLFDEKICGSIHFTPGRCYEDCWNGNVSKNHWDIVWIQRPEYGGGEIWFDGELIRKDGRFIPEDLQCLNPENLK